MSEARITLQNGASQCCAGHEGGVDRGGSDEVRDMDALVDGMPALTARSVTHAR